MRLVLLLLPPHAVLLHLLILYVPPPSFCQLVDPLATALHPANAPCRAVLLHLLILYVPPLAAMFSVVALRWDSLWRLVGVANSVWCCCPSLEQPCLAARWPTPALCLLLHRYSLAG